MRRGHPAYRLERFGGLICGAGPLLKDTAVRFEDRFGFPIRHGYGLSETTCYSCFLPNRLAAGATPPMVDRAMIILRSGVALSHNMMAILNDRGRPVPEGSRGEICIRGRTVCAGYFKRPDANDAAFRWGWFRSGDEGFYCCDERGRPFFFISGRMKELIIRGGVNISPLEIDDGVEGASGGEVRHGHSLSKTAITARRSPPTSCRRKRRRRRRRRASWPIAMGACLRRNSQK